MPISIRGTQNLIRGFAVPFIFVCGSVLAATSADEITNLSTYGAPTLALELLKQTEPKRDLDPVAWLEWQQRKISIYHQQQQWDQVIRELESVLGSDLSSDSMQWVWTQMAQAYLMTDRGEEARTLLAPVIWIGADLPSHTLQAWRRMLVESYLSEDRVVDAYSAMLRYRQDYADDAVDWSIIQAQVLLANDRAPEAIAMLKGVDDRRAEVIVAMARHRRGETLEPTLLDALATKLRESGLAFELRQQLLIVLVGQANLLPVGGQQIQLLEHVVIAAEDVEGIESSTAVDRLWRAYQDYGNQLANESQLLVGDFEPWYSEIDRIEKTSPLEARALLAVMVDRNEKDIPPRVHLRFSQLLVMQERDKSLLRPLYLGGSQAMEVSVLPEPVLYLLIDQSLNGGDQVSAAKLMNLLQESSAAQTIDWRLRRARSQILAGVASVGADIAKELVRSGQSLDKAQFEYLIRIGFELQRAGRLDAAFQLFSLMLKDAPELTVHRELLFWMADIRVTEKKFDESARLYFQAADMNNSDAQDFWTQIARQQAAQSLARAGYLDDARQVYEHLLHDVGDPARRAVLERELQQLKLLARPRKG
jgi:tetratricopeptide (TPR) repeat protein